MSGVSKGSYHKHCLFSLDVIFSGFFIVPLQTKLKSITLKRGNLKRIGFRKRDLSWVFELLLLYFLLLLVDSALPGAERLASISPHPFWIPVVLISVQYGIGGGLAAALSAIALSLLMDWPRQAGGEDFYDYSLRVWREPILWLGAAVILGALRAQQMYKLSVLREKLTDADIQRQSVATLCNRLKVHCEDLERSMACAQDRSIEAGLNALTDVRNSTIENLRSSLAAAVDLMLGPATYTVLTRRDGHLIENPHFGSEADSPCRSLTTGSLNADLEGLLLRGTRVLSILCESDSRTLAGTAIFAAPIVSSGSERVLGALLVHTMDASHLSPHIQKIILALCGEIAHALNRNRVVVSFELERVAGRGAGFGHAEEAGGARNRYDTGMAAAAEQSHVVAAGGRGPLLCTPERGSTVVEVKAAKQSARSLE